MMPQTRKEKERMHESRWLKRVQDLEHLCKCQQAELEAIKTRIIFDNAPRLVIYFPMREDKP